MISGELAGFLSVWFRGAGGGFKYEAFCRPKLRPGIGPARSFSGPNLKPGIETAAPFSGLTLRPDSGRKIWPENGASNGIISWTQKMRPDFKAGIRP